MPSVIAPVRYEDPEYQKAHTDLYIGSLRRTLEQILPPGVSREDFNLAVKEFVEILGEDAVFTGEALQDYVDPYEIPQPHVERKVPSAAVCPASIDHLRAILQIANKFSIPVWTFSRGKNIGYGGPAPRLPGSVALDLHRMNKIIDANEKFAYAVVEPGVTFTDLYNYCVAKGLRVWPSVPSLGWGSVIGNTLDRGAGFTPTASHHEHIAGLEVMLADGDVVRTGQWAMSTSPSAHLSKFSFGPSIEGLFLQSNLGIVCKMGIWLSPQPQAYMSCSFDMPNQDDVGIITDTFGELRRNGVLPNICYIFNIIEWSAIIGKRAELWEGEGTMPDSRIQEIQDQIETGHWSVKFSLYGAKDIIEAQFSEVKKVVTQRMPNGRLKGQLFEGEGDRLLDPQAVTMPHGGMFVGVPSLWSLPLVKYMLPKDRSDGGAHSAYSAIIPLDGKTMVEWYKVARRVYAAEGFDAMCDFFMHGRHAVFVCMLCFDKTNKAQTDAIDRIFHNLFEEGKKFGFSKYRSHIDHMDMVSDQMDFNNHAYRRFVEKIKDSLDPNGILSPGKQGIWPQKYRHLRENTSNGHIANDNDEQIPHATNGDATNGTSSNAINGANGNGA